MMFRTVDTRQQLYIKDHKTYMYKHATFKKNKKFSSGLFEDGAQINFVQLHIYTTCTQFTEQLYISKKNGTENICLALMYTQDESHVTTIVLTVLAVNFSIRRGRREQKQ